ncbi:hypothetical protein DL771_005428 [Monosporascus sp. 5C6A]|nr:hypothetical protein DL771_005428 [Monosporascus sp. 5C6A]
MPLISVFQDVLGAAAAASVLLETAIRSIERVRTASERQQNLTEVLDKYALELGNINTIVQMIKDEDSYLQTVNVASELTKLRAVGEELVQCLKTLDSGDKGSVHQPTHQLAHASDDWKKLAGIMEDLDREKSNVCLRIQFANVGLTSIVGDTVLANAEVIGRIDRLLVQVIGEGQGLKLASLLKGRAPQEGGLVSLSKAEIASLNEEAPATTDPKAVTGSRLDGETFDRVIIGNSAIPLAVQLLGDDIWALVSKGCSFGWVGIAIGNIIATAVTIVNSLPGIYPHLGFPVFNRAVWGMRGAQFAIRNRIFLSFVGYGFTCWVGGQCVYVVLISWDPHLEEHILNTMSEDTGMITAQFVAYVIFCTVSLPSIWIKPHRLQGFSRVTGAATLGFFLLHFERYTKPGQLHALRDAARPALCGQAVPYPLYAILSSLVSTLVTAATQHRFGGGAVWDPPTLFVRLMAQAQQQDEGGRGTRAACFFAGLGLTVNQLGLNVTANALAGGFDLAVAFPRFINIRRGAYLTALLSIAVNPRRLVNTSTTFLTVVLSSYSVFIVPMTGLMVSSYLIVNRCKIIADDLYDGTEGSIYWYSHGCNRRAPVAAFPADACSAFVRGAPAAKAVRHMYLGKWDVALSEMRAVAGELRDE